MSYSGCTALHSINRDAQPWKMLRSIIALLALARAARPPIKLGRRAALCPRRIVDSGLEHPFALGDGERAAHIGEVDGIARVEEVADEE